jgi:hypothetical protein
VRIRLHGTEEECRETVKLLGSVMLLQSASEPYPDRGRSVLVRACIEAIPRGGR